MAKHNSMHNKKCKKGLRKPSSMKSGPRAKPKKKK